MNHNEHGEHDALWGFRNHQADAWVPPGLGPFVLDRFLNFFGPLGWVVGVVFYNTLMIHSFLGASPVYDESNYIAPSADVIGDVVLGKGSSIWFNVTVRADVNWIRIGEATNIQDNSVVHVTNRASPTRIGDQVTVGHSAVIHGCTVADRVLVGMGAVILDQAVIGPDCIIGARALVTQRSRIPPRSLVLGTPARVVRQLTEDEVADILRYCDNYLQYSAIYRGQEQPLKNPFYDRP